MIYYSIVITLNATNSKNEIRAQKILRIIYKLLPTLRFYGWEYDYNYYKNKFIVNSDEILLQKEHWLNTLIKVSIWNIKF